MARLYLIRHGEASEPGDRRFPTFDRTLTEKGKWQARALAQRLRSDLPPDSAIYASDLPRARETADLIRSELRRDLGSPPTFLAALREIDFGDWAGRTYAEIIAGDPAAERFFGEVTEGAPPGGESAEAVVTRMHRALGSIAAAHPAPAVAMVVGHAGSLRLALARALGMPLANYWRLRLDPASVSIVDWRDDAIVVERLGDVSHLETAGVR